MTALKGAAQGPSKWARLALLASVLLAGTVRWQNSILEGYLKPDEKVYVEAEQLWSAGRSPYEESAFLYTPVFAWTAAQLTERYTSRGYLQIQRISSFVGICVATWLAFLIARWRTWPALITSVLWIWLAPGPALSIEMGNATGVSTALTLASLWTWHRQPCFAGFALGLAQAVKPIAPLAALGLIAHRQGSDPRRSTRAGWVAIAVACLLLLIGLRYLPGFFANATGFESPYNFSLQHLLAQLGLDIRPIWVSLILGTAGLWWIASRRLSRSELLITVLTLNLLAAPILWAHSLLLFLPVQLLAARRLARSLRSIRSTPSSDARRRLALPHLIAGLALAATVFSGSTGGLALSPAWLEAFILAVPYFSLLYLGLYALQEQRLQDDSTHERPSQPA